MEGAIISLAICVETLIRRITSNFLANPPDESFQEIIDRVSISTFLQQWKKLDFKSRRLTKVVDLKKLQDLFTERNRIMHRGQRNQVTISYCRDMFTVVRVFLKEGDRYLSTIAELQC